MCKLQGHQRDVIPWYEEYRSSPCIIVYRAWKDSPKLVNCMGLGDIGVIGST